MQLRQFLWIFLRCAHVTVNGMNRNVRTVCSILWNCYDFFFSYHIIYLPGNFCKSPGSLSCLNNIFIQRQPLQYQLLSQLRHLPVHRLPVHRLHCHLLLWHQYLLLLHRQMLQENQLLLLYEPHTDLLLLRFFQACDLTVNTVEITGCLKLRFPESASSPAISLLAWSPATTIRGRRITFLNPASFISR